MADTFTIPVDTWSPTVKKLKRNLSKPQQRKALFELGTWLVFWIKLQMQRQKGLATGRPYRKLKIKYRYHGKKELVASIKNLKRAGRSGPTGKNTVMVTTKVRVTPSTKALIDRGDLQRSWDIAKLTHKRVDVSPATAAENAKARYNDDRGDWHWGKKVETKAFRIWVRIIDKGVFD